MSWWSRELVGIIGFSFLSSLKLHSFWCNFAGRGQFVDVDNYVLDLLGHLLEGIIRVILNPGRGCLITVGSWDWVILELAVCFLLQNTCIRSLAIIRLWFVSLWDEWLSVLVHDAVELLLSLLQSIYLVSDRWLFLSDRWSLPDALKRHNRILHELAHHQLPSRQYLCRLMFFDGSLISHRHRLFNCEIFTAFSRPAVLIIKFVGHRLIYQIRGLWYALFILCSFCWDLKGYDLFVFHHFSWPYFRRSESFQKFLNNLGLFHILAFKDILHWS